MALWQITKRVSVLRERLSRWTEAKGEHGFSKDHAVPTRVLKKTNTKPAPHHKVCALEFDVTFPEFAGEGLGRGWERL